MNGEIISLAYELDVKKAISKLKISVAVQNKGTRYLNEPDPIKIILTQEIRNNPEVRCEIPYDQWSPINSLMKLATKNDLSTHYLRVHKVDNQYRCIGATSSEIYYALYIRQYGKLSFDQQVACHHLLRYDCNCVPKEIVNRVDQYRAYLVEAQTKLRSEATAKERVIYVNSDHCRFGLYYTPLHKSSIRRCPWEIRLAQYLDKGGMRKAPPIQLSQEEMELIVSEVSGAIARGIPTIRRE